MKTSVVISTYNGERFIIEELESILHQTRLPDEVLLFDDQSSDNTVSLIKSFIEDNALSSWRIQVNAVNKGWKRNFMEGIKEATGDIVFIADQDDIWVKDKVSIMTSKMYNNPEILLLVSDFIKFKDDDTVNTVLQEEKGSLSKADMNQSFLAVNYPGCTYCVRKSFLDNIFSDWVPEFAHDSYLWKCAVVRDGAYVLSKPLILWRKHDDSTFSIEKKEQSDRTSRYDGLLLQKKYLSVLDSQGDILNAGREIIREYSIFTERRMKFYDTKNPLLGLKLLFSVNKYRDFKQYLSDWVSVYIRK